MKNKIKHWLGIDEIEKYIEERKKIRIQNFIDDIGKASENEKLLRQSKKFLSRNNR